MATLQQQLRRPRGSAIARGRIGGLIGSFTVFVFGGLVAGVALARGIDPFTAVFFSSSSFMLLYAVFVVMEFATIVTGPDDLAFYTPLPVRPRQYVAAKIFVTWIFGLAFVLAFMLPSLIIVPVRGGSLGILPALVFSLIDSALITSLAVIVLLGLAVRSVSYRRVREVAAWAQFVIYFGVYGAFFIFQRSWAGAAGLRVEPGVALLLAPSSWAASVLRLGSGPVALVGLLLCLAAPFLLYGLAVRVISSAYDGKLADAQVALPRAPRRARVAGGAGFLWRSPEERGVALLIANLFRHDTQFRMGVLAIIPVTILYVGIIIFSNGASIVDPFTPAGRAEFGSTILLYLAVGFFPTYLKSALTYSSQAEAGWLFHASPADRLLVLRAARRFILLFFVTPYMVALAALYAVLTRQIPHTLQHFAAVALLVVIEVDVLLLYWPQLPFSRQVTAGRRGGGALFRMLAGVVILLPIYLLVVFAYPSPIASWIALAVLAVVVVTVRVTGKRHAARLLDREELAA
jgi:hypothetical protein